MAKARCTSLESRGLGVQSPIPANSPGQIMCIDFAQPIWDISWYLVGSDGKLSVTSLMHILVNDSTVVILS